MSCRLPIRYFVSLSAFWHSYLASAASVWASCCTSWYCYRPRRLNFHTCIRSSHFPTRNVSESCSVLPSRSNGTLPPNQPRDKQMKRFLLDYGEFNIVFINKNLNSSFCKHSKVRKNRWNNLFFILMFYWYKQAHFRYSIVNKIKRWSLWVTVELMNKHMK